MTAVASSPWAIVLPDGQRVPVPAAGVRFGREQGSCDVLLASGKVSRSHALVWVDEHGRPWVKDLGSANGTAVDGERVAERQLRDGSVVQLGDVQLRVARLAGNGSGDGGPQAHAAMGDPGYVFGPGRWARPHELPSASPIFDRDAMAQVVLPAGVSADLAIDEEAGSGGFGKLTVFLAIVLLGALIFFDISNGKLIKERTELLTKSTLATARIESQRMQGTRQLVEKGELAAQPLAICNTGSTPLAIDWVGAAAPAPNPVPGDHLVEYFNSSFPRFSCRPDPVTVPPGARLGLDELRRAWPTCKLPATAYLLAAGHIHEAGKEWVRSELLSAQNPCLRIH